MKEEYKKDLYKYVYQLLLKHEGVDSTNFFRASSMIEMTSEMVLNYTPKFEWTGKEYWHYLYRRELSKKILFNGTKLSKKNKKWWVKEMACVLYNEFKEEQQQRQQKMDE